MVAIDQIANTPFPLSQRERKITDLEHEIGQLQRTEEAIVVATGAPRERGLPALGRAGGEGCRGTRRPRRVMCL